MYIMLGLGAVSIGMELPGMQCVSCVAFHSIAALLS